MSYEIDFIGVGSEKCSQDADAICLRWLRGTDIFGLQHYTVGVVDGGFEAHGEALIQHMNKYYFDDKYDLKKAEEKTIDFMVITHPDQDHTVGLKKVLENFNVQKIYMNRPWLYVNELYDKVDDGRITKSSLKRRLREKYRTIADIEDIAEEKEIPIYEAFQGTYIEDEILIVSPEKQFYLDLLVESEKTPLQETSSYYKEGIFTSFAQYAKKKVLNLLESWDIETLRDGEVTSAENETSVVIRGIVDGSGFLLTGDAGIRALNKAIDYMDAIGEEILNVVSFYQIPHHGGRHNVSPSLLNRMIGPKLDEGEETKRSAVASVAKDSDHPLKMVTNAYIRRGVTPYKTQGNTFCHHEGQMPNRGWSQSVAIAFSDYVEDWDV